MDVFIGRLADILRGIRGTLLKILKLISQITRIHKAKDNRRTLSAQWGSYPKINIALAILFAH